MKQKFLFLIVLFFILSAKAAYGQILQPGQELPDNIVEACSVAPPSMEWGIEVGWTSDKIVSTLVIPMVGDMDGDGIPEIVCFADEGRIGIDATGMKLNTVLIYNGKTKALVKKFAITGYITGYDASAYGLFKRPDDKKGLLVVACDDFYLRAYDINGTLVWTSNALYGTASTKEYAVNIGFTDFNQDGYPEVYVRDKIYDASTGILLATATGGNNIGYVWTHHSSTTGHRLSSPLAADVTGDSKMELILGNEIYDVTITNRAGTGGNSAIMTKTITPPSPVITDGFAQVADFNKDGHLDILIVNRDNASVNGFVGGYIWDVHNNTVSSPIYITTTHSGVSFPLIADIDSDDELEILIQMGASGTEKYKCFKYNSTTRTFSVLWGFAPDENTYSNGATLFDFNQDGMNEVLLTDQSKVRILNGTGIHHSTGLPTVPVYTMATFDFGQVTIMQYPVIADVDGDGSADILLIGEPNGSGGSYNGQLTVLTSSDPNYPWAPARKVWNQYAYNSLNVNEDLTIPKYPISPATVFPGKDGNLATTNDNVRPFNNFLQQQTTLNHYGTPLWPAANGQITGTPTFNYNEANDEMIVTVQVYNAGDAEFQNPFWVTVYRDNVGNLIKESYEYQNTIAIGATVTITFTIENFRADGWMPYNFLMLKINDNGDGTNDQDVCDDSNSRYRYCGILPTQQEACKDNIATMTCIFSLSGNDTYQWQYSINDITWTDISGATAKTYQPAYQEPGIGYYRVVVTNDDEDETEESASVMVISRRCVMPVNPNTHLYK